MTRLEWAIVFALVGTFIALLVALLVVSGRLGH
jgi:hypothetical protein